METKVKFTVLVYTQDMEIPYELTIEASENILRLNKCLKDKISHYIKSGDFIYFAQTTITIKGTKYNIMIWYTQLNHLMICHLIVFFSTKKRITTDQLIEDDETIPTKDCIAKLWLKPKGNSHLFIMFSFHNYPILSPVFYNCFSGSYPFEKAP